MLATHRANASRRKRSTMDRSERLMPVFQPIKGRSFAFRRPDACTVDEAECAASVPLDIAFRSLVRGLFGCPEHQMTRSVLLEKNSLMTEYENLPHFIDRHRCLFNLTGARCGAASGSQAFTSVLIANKVAIRGHMRASARCAPQFAGAPSLKTLPISAPKTVERNC